MAGANGFINTGGAIDQAVAALPETISALFCSAAEAHAVLQAASWLQQLGQKCEHKPLQGAIVGLQQQSSRKAGLLRMRLLLVRHGKMALGSGDGALVPERWWPHCVQLPPSSTIVVRCHGVNCLAHCSLHTLSHLAFSPAAALDRTAQHTPDSVSLMCALQACCRRAARS